MRSSCATRSAAIRTHASGRSLRTSRPAPGTTGWRRMDDLARAIVDRGQGGFPVSSRPFRDAARVFATTERVLLDRIQRLLAERTLTRFGPLFDVERMGGRFTLAALAVPACDFERV